MIARTTENKAAFIFAPSMRELRRYDRHKNNWSFQVNEEILSYKEMLSRRLFKVKWLEPINPEEGC
jgi:hypothetical protein